MNETAAPVTIVLRIPGKWAHPKELVAGLPKGCRLTPDTLTLPDGTKVDFDVADADDKFARIFRSSCRQPPTQEEQATVDDYRANVC